MPLLQINRNPSKKDLFWFSVLWFPIFFVIVGAVLHFKFGQQMAGLAVAGVGFAIGLACLALPALARIVWIGWMTLFFPIGWAITHILMALTYYLVVTPTGLLIRLLGIDPMQRKLDRAAPSYWIAHRPGGRPERYFRQF